MLRVSRGLAPGALREDEHARIWAWSDLHLGHTETLRAFGRPFASADEMDDKSFKGKRARYYRLTPSGREHLTVQQSRWEALSVAMARVLRPAEQESGP